MRSTKKPKEHFVYKWMHPEGFYYIGKHSGTEDDGYIGSGVVFRQCYDMNPEVWSRTILSKYPNSNDALAGEKRMVGNRWKDDAFCLNICPGGKVHHKAMMKYYQDKLHNLMLAMFSISNKE